MISIGADVAHTSLFTAVGGDLVLPTDYSRGPWDPRSLHGGPVAALFAHAVERLADDDSDWFVARLTVEFERPVPAQPLRLEVATTRPGRKISLVDATLILAATGTTLARARALRIRRTDLPLPMDHPALAPSLVFEPAPPGPEHGSASETLLNDTYIGFHNRATDHRFIGDSTQRVGPVVDWIRMVVPVLPDLPLTPLQRVVAAADFANGISHVLPFDSYRFINPDLTVHVFRPLRGEWVGLSSTTHHDSHGVGMSDSGIFDLDGRVGRSNQSLLFETR
jgi:Thioesterase-like superfamily